MNTHTHTQRTGPQEPIKTFNAYKYIFIEDIGYRLRCSSRVRKVMRLGSGSERSRCIMQFSFAAGSDRAGGDSRDVYQIQSTRFSLLSLNESESEQR